MLQLESCKLYAFLDAGYLQGRSAVLIARQLCDGGADLIQLRAKHLAPDDVRLLAENILPIAERSKVGMVINDHVSIALDTGSPWCHLGQEDFFEAGFSQVSQLIPPGRELGIGMSTHSPVQAERAIQAGAAYIAVGPVHATPTKPMAKPVTLDYVRWAAAHVRIPWFAIGGITLDNLDEILEAGASRICVVSAILKSADVAKACHAFKRRLMSAQV